MDKIQKQLERAFPEAIIDIRYLQSLQIWKVIYSDDHKFSISKQPVSLEYLLSLKELEDVETLINKIKQDEDNYEK